MAGNKEGGLKTAAKNIANDPDFYARIGAIGGRKGKADGVIKGFAANPELARRAGKKGGQISRRGKSSLTLDQRQEFYRNRFETA